MTTTTETNHYVDERAARRCYKDYGWNPDNVPRDIKDGTIVMGPPALAAGETLILVDEGARYAIVTA